MSRYFILLLSMSFVPACFPFGASVGISTGYYQDSIPSDQRVKVLWGSTWYDGVVLDERGNQFLVHYLGWSSASDEWVTEDRIRFPQNISDYRSYYRDRYRRYRHDDPRYDYSAGGLVEVFDGSSWYRATILSERRGQYYIHYHGWSDSFDCWVTRDRVRPAR